MTEDSTIAVFSRGQGESPQIESAAWEILRPGLLGEPSPLDSSVVTWTKSNALNLLARVQDDPDMGPGSFVGKLTKQLADAPRVVVLLAAELLYLQVVPLSNVGSTAKLSRIETVLSWLSPRPDLSKTLSAALETEGVFNGGAGFNVQLWRHLCWLCRFVVNWVEHPAYERAGAFVDPWKFRAIAAQTAQDLPSIRYSLQYLTWPGFFEAVVSRPHRKAIHNAFAHLIGGATGTDDESVDRDLLAIRRIVDAEASARVGWYNPPYKGHWLATTEPGRRAWLVRPRQDGAELVERWVREEMVSMRASHLGEVPPGASLPAVQAAVESGYQHQDYAQRMTLTSEYHDFLSRMKPDDIVVTLADNQVRVGALVGDAEYVEDSQVRLQRGVTWSSVSHSKSDMPEPVPALLDLQGIIVDLTSAVDVLDPLLREPDDNVMPEPQPEVLQQLPEVPHLRFADDALATKLFIPRPAIQEIIDLLQTRQQLVLYGPPGTGKTFLAQAIAEHIVGSDSDRAVLVQFHPAYAYEDFFEGYRPTITDTGQASFSIQPGPLRRIASAASDPENRGAPFVLIIDEMNRANLAKVFGELYFLLEYRRRFVQVQYNPTKPFQLPPNLFIIGTMNTADRSIAMVDSAIRRRFPFVELHPDEPPVLEVLSNYLSANHRSPERARLLKALNGAIEDVDRDLRIGPSYLMRQEAETQAGLERIWKYDILPLLAEHYYGRMQPREIAARFGLKALQARPEAAGPAALDFVDESLELDPEPDID
jgi:5-methylcytosine-specific restriction protein B